MKNMTCIICPNSCALSIDEATGRVTGNKCARGLQFAVDELTNPKRSVTTTVKTTVPGFPVVSVKTTGEIAKSLISSLMFHLNRVLITEECPSGTIIIKNFLKTGVDIVTTRSMTKEGEL
ncbi:MAG: DUF1667 domain-containing protein [Methanomicrobia archaeon]|nr:DUF1667 domain-containing protein [Methanomicrobia archaeon]